MAARECIAVGLIPRPDVRSRMDAVIADHASRHNRAVFTSHLTLLAGLDPAAATEDVVAAVARAHAPLTLEPNGLLISPSFTRSFCLRYHVSPALTALRDALARIVGSYGAASFDPHISLTYGEAPDPEALRIASEQFAGPLDFVGLETNVHHMPDVSQDDIAAFRSGPLHALLG